ncbi:MAG TPA: rod shape-determining protein MreB, partial [Anaerovoracaceae bacterium]|nr:rod shape-determining protein MreB [Anaerovoracaceae bacterium]
TQTMLREYVQRIIPRKRLFTQLRAVVGIPSGVTEVEKRAVEEVIRQMGAREVYTIVEPMAAAIGAGLDIDEARGCMVVDIGGGTLDIAILSLGDIVSSNSIRSGGDKMDEAIAAFIRKKYNLLIGIALAEKLKIGVGYAYPVPGEARDKTMTAKGRDVITGLPSSIEVQSADIITALEDSVRIIVDGIKRTLEQSPPEIASDIADSGLVLEGGGALLRGLDVLLERETGLKVLVAGNAMTAVAEGTGKSLMNIARLRYHAQTSRKY